MRRIGGPTGKQIGLVAVVLALLGALAFLYGNRMDSAKTARAFLEAYYSLRYEDSAVIDVDAPALENFDAYAAGLEREFTGKYAGFMTESCYESSVANATFSRRYHDAFDGKYDSVPTKITLDQDKNEADRAHYYFVATVAATPVSGGAPRETTEEGQIILIKQDGEWRINYFRIF